MRYNVRCCCQPTKIFGTLDLPAVHIETMVPVWKKRQAGCASASEAITVSESHRELVKMRRFFDAMAELTGIAVYSDDRPIEFWREIQGFKEGDRI